MKKITYLSLFLSFLFVSCGAGSLIGGGDGSSATWYYSSSNDTFIVNPSVFNLTVNGALGGKTLYYTCVNTSSVDIDIDYVKYISGVESRNGEESPLAFETNDFDLPEEEGHYIGYDFYPDTNACRSAAEVLPLSSSTTTSFVVGETSKTIWVETAKGQNKNKASTLWATNDVCNVWVVDDYYEDTTTEESIKVNKATAQAFADKFNALYPLVTGVLGEPTKKIYVNGSWQDLADYSDTGTKVNIVISDIDCDGADGSVLGFFSSKDYDYYNTATNKGLYFYIDSYFANANTKKLYSTLAHEFQHMIHYGKKYIEKGLSSDTNFHEMLSMLTEDMVQAYLGNEDSNTPKGRLNAFSVSYTNIGFRDWSDSSTTSSYANAYAFGAWLCRQYGGAALIKEMMENNYVNTEAIVAAVNKLNNTEYEFIDLFAQFTKACYGLDSTYTFNRNAKTTVSTLIGTNTTYYYPMTAINLWEEDSIYDLSKYSTIYVDSNNNAETLTYAAILNKVYGNYIDSHYSNYGPVFLKRSAIGPLKANYGMLMHYGYSLGEGLSGMELTFATNSGYSAEGMVVICYIK